MGFLLDLSSSPIVGQTKSNLGHSIVNHLLLALPDYNVDPNLTRAASQSTLDPAVVRIGHVCFIQKSA